MAAKHLLERGDHARQAVFYRITGRPGPCDRPALPAGHPISWGLLTDGTALEGADYPYPVFLDLVE